LSSLRASTNEGVPGVVDQGVDSPGAIKNCAHTTLDRLFVANIDVDRFDTLQSFLGSAVPPRGPEDSETVAGKQTGDGSTDSR
jgi:hypothetical protein